MRRALTIGGSFLKRSRDFWLAGALTVGGVYFFSGRFTTVRFDQERIEVRLESHLIQVTGLYHYINRSRLPAVLTLGVPFPVDRDHPPPNSFSLSEANEDGRSITEVPIIVRGGNVQVRLIFRPGEAKWIRLDYAQPTRVTNGRYLLKTTRGWHHPIGRGDYVICLPQDLRMTASNYSISPAPVEGRWRAYSFSKTNFYPYQDWVFAWEELRPSVDTRGEAHP